MQISYYKRTAIDDNQWNKCIDESVNGIVYAYSWYLDIVSPNWSALISDDYDYIFPLPEHKRIGIDVLLQPILNQQLGLFSRKHISGAVLNEFIGIVQKEYRYVNIHLNILNNFNINGFFPERTTYQLDLISNYNQIQCKYSSNTRRNNLKAVALGVRVDRRVSVNDFLDFYRNNNAVRFSKAMQERVELVVEVLLSRGLGDIVGAYINDTLCAAAFMVRSNGKLIYLFASSSPLGFKSRAMFAIVDQIIRWNAESHYVFDFEGSMIPSVARFYAGFGAQPCRYPHVIINSLPWYATMVFSVRNCWHSFKNRVTQ